MKDSQENKLINLLRSFDRKIVRRCLIRLGLTLAALALEEWLRTARISNSALRYPHQAAAIFLAVMLFLLWRALRRLIPQPVRDAVWRRVRFVFNKLIAPIRFVGKKLGKLFGIDRKRVYGEDEKSFVFDLDNANPFRRFQASKNQLKWQQLHSNAEKIRYLYIKYVVKLIKQGYPYKAHRTPTELRRDLNLKDDPERLFLLYDGARYGGDRFPISDEDVQMSMKLVKQKK